MSNGKEQEGREPREFQVVSCFDCGFTGNRVTEDKGQTQTGEEFIDHLQFCGHEVGKLETAAWPVTGWELQREKGANQIYDRQRVPNRVAHAQCLKARGQTSMLGDAA